MTSGRVERLQKLMARAGIASRRASEDLIADGRVRLNGRVATLGDRADPETDVVEVDGAPIALDPQLVYLAVHKPVGYVSTAADPQGRPLVLDLVPSRPRVATVGRLDRDTAGLILCTNDGDLANRVAHPRYEIPKTYVAEVRGKVPGRTVADLRRGIELDDGPARLDAIRLRDTVAGRTLLEMTLHVGRNRIVRRMLEAVDLEILSLTRTAIGSITLGKLKPGSWRTLRRAEIIGLLGAQPPPRS